MPLVIWILMVWIGSGLHDAIFAGYIIWGGYIVSATVAVALWWHLDRHDCGIFMRRK